VQWGEKPVVFEITGTVPGSSSHGGKYDSCLDKNGEISILF